jgi:hypothetical protein
LWQEDQVVKICMAISERSIGLFPTIFKLLENRIRAPTPTEPRLQQLLTLVKKLLRRHFLEADRLISESPDVISCQIMFQVFWLGYAIWELISGSGSEWNSAFTKGIYLYSFSCLIRAGVELYRTWKKIFIKANQECIV